MTAISIKHPTVYLDELKFNPSVLRKNIKNSKYNSKVEDIENINFVRKISEGRAVFYSDGINKIRFLTEQLIPSFKSPRPKVMLLFSNPHPGSLLSYLIIFYGLAST